MQQKLLITNLRLTKEWHPTFNKNLNIKDYSLGSNKKVWWLCSKGHEWKASIQNREYNKNNCPYCSNHRVCLDNCLITVNPKLAKEWHPTKNGKLTPREVTSGSSKKVWWMCSKGHAWKASITNREYNKSGCPFCTNRKVCLDNCLETINPTLAKEWHPVKNGKLTPKKIISGSHKKVWWMCSKGHEWAATVNSRNFLKRGCPYCSNHKVCPDSCLEMINPKLAKEWHPTKNGNLTPKNVSSQSNKKIWWICSKDHSWLAAISDRHSKGYGCPYCSNHKVCLDNCLITTHPELAKEWHPIKNKKLTPDKITHGSAKKIWWVCSKGHEWAAAVYTRSKGTPCPYCSIYQTQEKVRKIFEDYFKRDFPIARPRWLVNPKTRRRLELDGYCHELNLAFEYDGEWHYTVHYRSTQKKLELQQYRDALKDELCTRKKVILIRIPYTEKNNLRIYIKEELNKQNFIKDIFQ